MTDFLLELRSEEIPARMQDKAREDLARLFAAHGVRKLRLTGGEPLLRKGIEALIAQLAQLRTPGGDT